MAPPIVAVAFDVDGVFTDGTVTIAANGEQTKRITFLDIMGISRARRSGIRFALVSGEGGEVLAAIAAKLGVTDVWGGCRQKAAAVQEFADRIGVPLSQVAYVGDDINDVEAMKIVGLSAAPASAHASALATAQCRLTRQGGTGAVREILDALTDAAWDPERVLAQFAASGRQV